MPTRSWTKTHSTTTEHACSACRRLCRSRAGLVAHLRGCKHLYNTCITIIIDFDGLPTINSILLLLEKDICDHSYKGMKEVMKAGKHQRSKQRCKDLCWKVHICTQSFDLCSYTMHDLRNQDRFYCLFPQSVVNSYCVLCTVKARKENKKELCRVYNHSPLLTMFSLYNTIL